MARIILLSQSEDSRTRLSRLLASSGFQLFRCCASGSELRRALSESEDCVVMIAGPVRDCKPDEVLWDYGDRVRILLIDRQSGLDNCESPEIFRLALPLSGQAVIGALEMLTQLLQMNLPRRTGKDRDVVEAAKKVLMKREGFSEPEAHRIMQRYAMNHGMKMTEFAAKVLANQKGEES